MASTEWPPEMDDAVRAFKTDGDLRQDLVRSARQGLGRSRFLGCKPCRSAPARDKAAPSSGRIMVTMPNRRPGEDDSA